MQATGLAVKPSFYISMVVIIFIVIIVLYKLLQPRLRQITSPVFDLTSNPSVTPSAVPVQQPVAPTVVQNTVAVEPAMAQQNSQEQVKKEDQQIARPPRLNIPNAPRVTAVPRVPLTSAPQQRINHDAEYANIRNIFESAGYVYKGQTKIKSVPSAIIAIGTNEVLWIGAVGVKNADMQNAIQTLSGVFSDTLDDIEIHINAFVVAAPDATEAPADILQFATVDDLRNYIAGQPNTPPDTDEKENFDAYSGYIGTVIDYIGKI